MKKPIIIALVGASGSGKTTLSLYLQDKLAIPAVCSYTTRPMRPGEVNGREHWFVTEAEYERMAATESLLAYTKFGGYHYWTLESQVAKNLITTYVIDEKGLIELKINGKISMKFSQSISLGPTLMTLINSAKTVITSVSSLMTMTLLLSTTETSIHSYVTQSQQ